jgi:Tfp pilus assembly protein PilX
MKTRIVARKCGLDGETIMGRKAKHSGAVFLIVVFAIVLLATITVGILVMSTEELQLMQNQLYAAQALAVAEAGLNDAFAQIRADSSWTPDASYVDKSFPGYGTYTVQRSGMTITSEATSSQGYRARMAADITIGGSAPNCVIRIDTLRINE